MGLMAMYLVLRALNVLHVGLTGSINIYSDCEGALGMVEHIPYPCIPTHCKHTDVLKNILVHCKNFLFECAFHHIKAHQDDNIPFHLLDHPSQLNCMMDKMAKCTIRELHPDRFPNL